MLKVNRTNQTFSSLDSPSLTNAQFLERADLQECIYNSSDAFFAEIGEDVFVAGKEVAPSKTVQDRIDLLGIDPEGTLVIVELKRGSNKLQMLQAISYAGMVARWGPDELRGLLSGKSGTSLPTPSWMLTQRILTGISACCSWRKGSTTRCSPAPSGLVSTMALIFGARPCRSLPMSRRTPSISHVRASFRLPPWLNRQQPGAAPRKTRVR